MTEKQELALAKARQKCVDKMLMGQIPIFNFHYEALWQFFQSRNLDAIENGSGQISLEDFLQNNNFSSRAINPDGFCSLAKNVLYCALTVLRRIGVNYISALTNEWAKSFPEIFDFDLEPIEVKVKKMEGEYIQHKLHTDPDFCKDYYGEEI